MFLQNPVTGLSFYATKIKSEGRSFCPILGFVLEWKITGNIVSYLGAFILTCIELNHRRMAFNICAKYYALG